MTPPCPVLRALWIAELHFRCEGAQRPLAAVEVAAAGNLFKVRQFARRALQNSTAAAASPRSGQIDAMILLLCGAAAVAVYAVCCFTVLRLPKCQSRARLDGKTVVVTGSNTGIGKTTALDLAKRGARVILACRDQKRAEAAVSDIRRESGSSEVVYMHLDLASLQSVRSFAETFLKTEPRLDILINNAGLVVEGTTKDGMGMIFGVNHLGHFLLTLLLLDRLKESGPSRVVNVASKAYEVGKIDFDCLSTHKKLAEGKSSLSLFFRYSHSKLCNVLFTHELAKRLQGTNVTCYSLHPGPIKTDISRHSNLLWKMILFPILTLFFVDPVSGAQTTIHCALQEGIEPHSGRYFEKCAVKEVKAHGRDDAVAKKLWELSERLCSLA
ncbi:retinol dehydrogenase 12-like [Denticeps clupeoides]|nr:retinol dehydrogenase 12-like [Denticeps clupeoides]